VLSGDIRKVRLLHKDVFHNQGFTFLILTFADQSSHVPCFVPANTTGVYVYSKVNYTF